MTDTSLSFLAADSARTSLKRARNLFDNTSYASYIPKEDDRLHEISLARRLRTQYNQHVEAEPTAKDGNSNNAGAIVVSTVQDNDGTGGSKSGGTSGAAVNSTAGVLARFQQQEETKNQPSTGILVVSLVLIVLWFPYCCCCCYCSYSHSVCRFPSISTSMMLSLLLSSTEVEFVQERTHPNSDLACPVASIDRLVVTFGLGP